MAKYRKKPVVIEAVQITHEWFDGDHPNPLHPKQVTINPTLRCVFVDTLEGRMRGEVGDWIITGVKGERYPCKPDIFAMTYEPVTQHTPEPTERCQDTVVQEARELLLSRSERGINKYGVTLDRTDLSIEQWLTHAIEEQADSLVYLLRIRRESSALRSQRDALLTVCEMILRKAVRVELDDGTKKTYDIPESAIDSLRSAIASAKGGG